MDTSLQAKEGYIALCSGKLVEFIPLPTKCLHDLKRSRCRNLVNVPKVTLLKRHSYVLET